MLQVQIGISFCLWLAYGVFQSTRWPRLRKSVSGIRVAQRKVYGPLLMVGGAAVLLGTMLFANSLTGPITDSIPMAAWLIVTLGGLLFVHAQTMASLMMVSLIGQETSSTPCAFNSETIGNTHDSSTSAPI